MCRIIIQKVKSVLIKFLILVSIIPLAAFSIQSHQASYQITLDHAKKKTKIIDVQGRSIYKLENQCFGWQTKEDFLIIFIFDNGETTKIENKFETFETFDGKSFQFSLIEKLNDVENENFFGYANLSEKNLGGNAMFFSDIEKNIFLSEKVNFPITHLKKLIEKAKLNKKVFQSEIFLGSEFDKGKKVVTAIIGLPKKNDSKVLNEKIIKEFFWPINLAYFDPNSKNSEPEFEILAKLQENGIMIGFKIDYGEFSINAEIDNLEMLPKLDCK